MPSSFESLTPARIAPAKAVAFVAKDMMRTLWRAACAWRRRAGLMELAALDDRMLADLGLARGDIASATAEPLWRDPTLRLSAFAVERRAAERAHQRWRRGVIAGRRRPETPRPAPRQLADG
ncbi:hypothetical protein GCM10008171_20760 [Methylopila jiangsuensis]|uniref:YjiS-like domain-containing protein n=1 Tax=Methylopila jiangsuensis TaxID=586230 RepID=A0A9W6JGW5_9HYPH|nr:DUF1127 domain-containing protein [Methylopila jiangsuensis]MDR6286831.1 uncharacterized protein YjiS (DUF1127 family) [Methylopila jiangsuensis]GLK76822.1 hypothetical protein GCM10008171_20760 [Methylopila jiangsuensis]